MLEFSGCLSNIVSFHYMRAVGEVAQFHKVDVVSFCEDFYGVKAL